MRTYITWDGIVFTPDNNPIFKKQFFGKLNNVYSGRVPLEIINELIIQTELSIYKQDQQFIIVYTRPGYGPKIESTQNLSEFDFPNICFTNKDFLEFIKTNSIISCSTWYICDYSDDNLSNMKLVLNEGLTKIYSTGEIVKIVKTPNQKVVLIKDHGVYRVLNIDNDGSVIELKRNEESFLVNKSINEKLIEILSEHNLLSRNVLSRLEIKASSPEIRYLNTPQEQNHTPSLILNIQNINSRPLILNVYGDILFKRKFVNQKYPHGACVYLIKSRDAHTIEYVLEVLNGGNETISYSTGSVLFIHGRYGSNNIGEESFVVGETLNQFFESNNTKPIKGVFGSTKKLLQPDYTPLELHNYLVCGKIKAHFIHNDETLYLIAYETGEVGVLHLDPRENLSDLTVTFVAQKLDGWIRNSASKDLNSINNFIDTLVLYKILKKRY